MKIFSYKSLTQPRRITATIGDMSLLINEGFMLQLGPEVYGHHQLELLPPTCTNFSQGTLTVDKTTCLKSATAAMANEDPTPVLTALEISAHQSATAAAATKRLTRILLTRKGFVFPALSMCYRKGG
jgi:hypothetical protein